MDVFERSEKFLTSRGFVFHGPLFGSTPQHQKKISEVIEFRRQQNLLRAEHLESEQQHKIEKVLALDARSVHFCVESDDRIAASVRLTPGPFELTLLAPRLDLSVYRRYYEFSRLCTSVELDRKPRAAQALLIRAGHWLFSSIDCEGILALCNETRVPFMSRFGLRVLADRLSITGREGGYYFMGNHREAIKAEILNELERYQKRGVLYEFHHA